MMQTNTKRKIMDAFAALTDRKALDKITVKDLVDACGISRQTFYYHFQDIIDVIECAVEQTAQETLWRSLAAEGPEEAIGIFVSSVLDNRERVRRLLSSQRREQIEQILFQAFRSYLKEMFCRKGPQVSVQVGEMELVIDFFAYGIAGLLLECCQRGDTDAETLAGQLYRLLSGQIVEIQRQMI